MALEIRELSAGYGAGLVLRSVSMRVEAGQITCLMGRNGAGKSTLCKAISGLVAPTSGEITLDGQRISGRKPHLIARAGVAWVPQGRRLFAPLSVAENLAVASLGQSPARQAQNLARVLEMFPRLAERMAQRAGTLSGGEQQMLAIGRALCLSPKFLALDEPTEGLQPSMIALIRAAMVRLRDEGVAILLVEQRKEAALALADEVVFLRQGEIGARVLRADLSADDPGFARFVGV